MKKICLFLFLFVLLSSVVIAQEETPLPAYPFVCEREKLLGYLDKRYMDMGGNNHYPIIVIDKQTMVIDRARKHIRVWVIMISSQQGRENMFNNYHGNPKFLNYGVSKFLWVLDYGSPSYFMVLAMIQMSCEGDVLDNMTFERPTWSAISPGSTAEGVLNKIILLYKLR